MWPYKYSQIGGKHRIHMSKTAKCRCFHWCHSWIAWLSGPDLHTDQWASVRDSTIRPPSSKHHKRGDLCGGRHSAACQRPSGSWALPFNLLRRWIWLRKYIFGSDGHKKETTKKMRSQKSVVLLSGPTSHSGHMGAYLNWQTVVLAAVLDVHVCSLSHMHAHAHTLAFESPKSPFTLQNPQCRTHTASCLFGYTSSAHTLTPAHALTQTHTHHRGPPSPYCPSIWLVPFVPHILLAADGKLLQGAAGACPDLLKTYNITWDSAF